MDNFIFALNAVLPLFLIMALGFGLKFTKIGTEEFFSKANALCFKVLLPVMLFVNIYELTPSGVSTDMSYIGLAVVGVIGCALLTMIVLPFIIKDKRKVGVMSQAMFRSNFLIFGVPVVRNMFGESELWATSVLLPIVVPMFNILAVVTLSIYVNEDRSFKGYLKTLVGIIKNPLILAAFAAYLVAFLKIEIPDAVFDAADNLASMATPLALIALGGTLKFSSIRKNLGHIIAACSVKLLVLPAVMLPVAVGMGFHGSTIGALLALFASPVAVSSYIMAVAADNDGDLAAQIVAISTAASIFTMFFWIFILRSAGAL